MWRRERAHRSVSPRRPGRRRIGVTPFASVLESLIRRQERGSVLEKALFFWLDRDPYSFEWFAGLLLRPEALAGAQEVDIHVYGTGGQQSITAAALNLARDVPHAAGKPDLVTGLRTRTHLGQPAFDKELKRVARAHVPNPVELFFCGPPGLGRSCAARPPTRGSASSRSISEVGAGRGKAGRARPLVASPRPRR